jgi:pimeloyl-ACP methyl ester carboxylesterase
MNQSSCSYRPVCIFAIAYGLLSFIHCYAQASEIQFRVTSDQPQPGKGRLIVFLIHEGSKALKNQSPINGPFWNDSQPLFAIDADLKNSQSVVVDDRADYFPVPPSKLAPGSYRVQARFDRARLNSNWRREPGNLWSDVTIFTVKTNDPKDASGQLQVVELVLKNETVVDPKKPTEGVEWFEVKSDRLSKYRGSEVMLRAGVVLPTNYDPTRTYPALYEVPGFGGDHSSAASARRRSGEGARAELASTAFRIVLDPEGPNGHSLFADSANNGPCGQALVEELVPALEAKYPLISKASARLLQGHSSGGWSTLWLALQYPETFGASWPSAPDPVDFRRFQKVDIYSQANFYVDEKGNEMPSLRRGDKVTMSIRQEARGEDILGPDNTSAQQWDSWFAAFGPRNTASNPAALFDPISGAMDRSVAEQYRKFDIGHLLRTDPKRYLPIFRNNIRLICGTEDSFYLNEAVALLKAELTKLGVESTDVGYVKLVPGDHGSVMAHESARAAPSEMLEHLKKSGHFAHHPE